MKKKVYILNEQGKYVGEGIEAFGISYVNKTEVEPDSKFLNGDYDVVWNGKEWEYIKVKGIEEVTTYEEKQLTEEELKAIEEEKKRLRVEHLKSQAKDLLPHLVELFKSSEEFKALLQGAKDADKSI